ncbi:SPOR domain-containing protein [Polymorphobacter sp.]|uniref:SPOR domain-containing protein n=1 Tax=Polymorphobacter sp. TaxID=1909290 RepID=UPI003F6ECF9A
MADDDAPWLAEARPQRGGRDGGRGGTSVSRRSFFLTLAGGLALLAAVIVGAFLLISREEQSNGDGYMEASQAPLITAEPGPFKVKPEDPMGLDVEGQDQTLYAAGIGIDEGSNIDVDSVPEEPLPRPGMAPADQPAKNLLPPVMQQATGAPVTAPATPAAPATAPGPAAKPVVPVAPAAPAAKPAPPVVKPVPVPPPPAAAPAAGGGGVQLGAFSSRERAEIAWSQLVKKHGLIGVSPQYSPIERDGTTLYRLRGRGGDAQAICARLAKSGDACSVVP